MDDKQLCRRGQWWEMYVDVETLTLGSDPAILPTPHPTPDGRSMIHVLHNYYNLE